MDKREQRPFSFLGKNISARRGLLKISQEKFSALTGTAISSLKNIERGVNEGHIDTRLAIADVLKCDLAELYCDSKVPSEPKRYSFLDAADFLSNVANRPKHHQALILALAYGDPDRARGISNQARQLLQALLKAL